MTGRSSGKNPSRKGSKKGTKSSEPQPGPSREPQAGPSREPEPGPSREPQPGPSREPQAGPSRKRKSGISREPQLYSAREPQPGPSWRSDPPAPQSSSMWPPKETSLEMPSTSRSSDPKRAPVYESIPSMRTYETVEDQLSVSSRASHPVARSSLKTSAFSARSSRRRRDYYPRKFFCGSSRNIGWFFALLTTSALCAAYHFVIVTDILCPLECEFLPLLADISLGYFSFMYILSFLITRLTLPILIPDQCLMTDTEKRTCEYYVQHYATRTNKMIESMGNMANRRYIKIRSMIGEILFCNECKILKPDRTQHCPICDMCVIRMDHHCRFFGNCIHLKNYKAYVLTMFYSAVVSGYIIFTTMAAGLVSPDALMSKPYPYRAHVLSAMLGFSILQFMVSMISLLSTMREAARNNTASGKNCRVLFPNNETYSYDLNDTFLNLREAFLGNWYTWGFPFPGSLPNNQLVSHLRKD